jgi:hypothetical protein
MPRQTVTKKQLERIIRAWRVEVKIPSKNKKTIVNFPNTDQYDFRIAIVEKTDKKSTDGLVLYSIEFKN